MVAFPSTPVPSEVSGTRYTMPVRKLEYDKGYTYTEFMYSKHLRHYLLEWVYLKAYEKNQLLKFVNDVRVNAELFTWTHPYGPTIIGASNASPIVITTQHTHNFYNNDQVVISGVTGNTAANGIWTITNTTSNTFRLSESIGSGVYTGGGTSKLRLPYVRIGHSEEEFSGANKTLGPDQNNLGVYTLQIELIESYNVPFLFEE